MTVAPDKTDLITCTIDGFEVQVPKGTLIIRAAEQIGIQIPRFCDHPLLDPVGACRQCLVEVPDMGNGRGMPKPAASCTTTVMPGMVVKTQVSSELAERAQRGNMELLLINHPLDCPICDKGGECPLQNQAMSSGSATSRFIDQKRTFPKPVAISTQVLLDRERCVQCARCTRFSQQVAGDPFIELFERGALEQVATAEGEPFQSYFSGNTVQICPVGALTGAAYRFRSRPFDLVSTSSVCEHCASGCAQRTDWRRGKVTRRLAGEDPQVNEEWNCDKGRWAFTYATQPDRITTPLVRGEDGQLHEASWTEALKRAAEGLREARDAGGVGVLPGGRITLEDAYAYAKFARVALGSNDIDMRARPHSAEELEFLAARVAGIGPVNGGVTYSDLEAAPAVLLAGFEAEEESPIIFLRLRKAARKSLQVYAVAPFATRGLEKMSGTLVPAKPGEEATVLANLPAEAREGLGQPGAIIVAGERLAEIAGALSAAAALASSTGARLAWVPRRAGERGAIEAGAVPSLLPGARAVTDEAARSEVESAWGTTIPAAAGRDVDGILAAARDGELDALVIGGLSVGDLPDPDLAVQALGHVGFVLSLELRRSSVTEQADVVLPVAAATEKAGTFVNWEGRLRPFELTLEGTSALPDSRVLHALAEEMDAPIGLHSTEAARAEIARVGTASSPRPADPSYPASEIPTPGQGEALLASWHYLLDAGAMQDGEPNLAGTARSATVKLSADTAVEAGVTDGGEVVVSTDRGAIRLPAEVIDMPDRVVWLPTRSVGVALRRTLGAAVGDVVRVHAAGGES